MSTSDRFRERSKFGRNRLATLLAIAALGAVAATPAPAADSKPRIEIAAGPAGQALKAFVAQTGLQLLFDFEAVNRLTTHSVSGELGAAEALSRMLAGTGLAFEFVNDRTVTITMPAAEKRATSETVSSNRAAGGEFRLAQAAQDGDSAHASSDSTGEVLVFGTREEGYVSNSAGQVGPLGDVALLDTPVSVYVMSRHLMENLQVVSSPDMLFKVNPVIQFTVPDTRAYTIGSLRGFLVDGTSRTDGIPTYSSMVSPEVVDKERVEVISGLSGFFNGVGNVGGSINYVRKRPTVNRLANLTVGLNGGRNAYVHGDFGGRLDESGRFGYRLNAMLQDGDTAVKDQSIERQFVSGSLDWHASDRLLLQLDASYSDRDLRGVDPWWGGGAFPDAPNPGNVYSPPWTQSKTQLKHAGVAMAFQLNDIFSVRARLERQESKQFLLFTYNLFRPGQTGDYIIGGAGQYEFPNVKGTGGHFYLDADLRFGSVSHKFTAGYYGNAADQTNTTYGPRESYANVYNLRSSLPAVSPIPGPVNVPKFKEADLQYDNFIFGDQIGIGEKWNLLLGINHSTIKTRTYEIDGTITTDYDDSRLSPSVAALYKLTPRVSAYASFMKGLEKGGTADVLFDGYPVANAGEILPPLVSDQVEVGLKAQMDNALFTAALFKLNKGLEYYDVTEPTAPVFTQDGRQVHKGLELTLTGEVVKHLIVVAGLTALDPKVEDSSDPTLAGMRPAAVAKRFGTLFAEYQIPALPSLFITGGAFYTGRVYLDGANTLTLPSSVSYDLGARYETQWGDRPIALRLNVANVTNEGYWLASHILGARRTFFFSVKTSLF